MVDVYLSGNPSISVFPVTYRRKYESKVIYKRGTNFAIEKQEDDIASWTIGYQVLETFFSLYCKIVNN